MTVPLCPKVEELEAFGEEQLRMMELVARLAIAKPYFHDRIKTAMFIKGIEVREVE